MRTIVIRTASSKFGEFSHSYLFSNNPLFIQRNSFVGFLHKPERSMAESTMPPPTITIEEKPAEMMTEEQKFKSKFPTTNKPASTDILRKRLQKGVKYFDSGDYNMAKTSKRPLAGVGAVVARPDNIPHRKTSVPSKLASPTSLSVQD